MAGKCQTLATVQTENTEIQFFRLKNYCSGFVMVAALTLLCRFLDIGNRAENGAIVLLYLLPVMFSAYLWGRGPSFFTALAGVAAFEFVIMDVNWRIMLAGNSHLWSLAVFFLVAYVIGDRTDLLRQKAATAHAQETKLAGLVALGPDIAELSDLQGMAAEMAKQVGLALDRTTSVLLASNEGEMRIWGEYNPRLALEEQRKIAAPQSLADSLEAATAGWTYQYGQISESAVLEPKVSTVLFMPLKVSRAVVGVLRIDVGKKSLSAEEKRLTDSWASLTASAMDRLLRQQKQLVSLGR